MRGKRRVLKKRAARTLSVTSSPATAIPTMPILTTDTPNYPLTLSIRSANTKTVEWVAKTGAKNVAELGVYAGATSVEIAKLLPPDGSLDLFDFADVATRTAERVRSVAKCPVRAHGNSRMLLDSYCWSLMLLLEQHREPVWDYVYIDGAHTWLVDGFAFILCDQLLRPGGYVDFDDYHWTLAQSPTLNPTSFPLTAKLYTPTQIRTAQVSLVCRLLVQRMGYIEVVPKKIYRKPMEGRAR